jgi:pyridoxamine 5'-phosphate oxidase
MILSGELLYQIDDYIMSKIINQSSIKNPLTVLKSWLQEAIDLELQPNPNSMALATVNSKGEPNVRMLLCKEINTQQGYIVFFTNYNSVKGIEIKDNSKSSAVFHWDKLGYQVRIKGKIFQSSNEESDEYFASRSLGSQIGAWASNQSSPIKDRQTLDHQFDTTLDQFEINNDSLSTISKKIPRPSNWGGYRFWVDEVELWKNCKDRLHDRFHFKRALSINDNRVEATNNWIITRLQP